VKSLNNFFYSLIGDQRLRYLIIGGINTIFGYLVSNLLYYKIFPWLHIVAVGVIANIICITFSFLTYKIFVFKTKGNWLKEYLRCYLVYGLSMILGILLMWGLVDGLSLPFWLCQGFVMILTIIFSYIGHSRFSFKSLK
jgi:putative flippase GtrA